MPENLGVSCSRLSQSLLRSQLSGSWIVMVRLHLSVDAATDVHLLRPDLFRALLLESADLGVQKRARFLQGALPQQGSLLVQMRSRPFVAAVRYDEMRATL